MDRMFLDSISAIEVHHFRFSSVKQNTGDKVTMDFFEVCDNSNCANTGAVSGDHGSAIA